MAGPPAPYSNDQLTDMILALGEAKGDVREAVGCYARMRPADAAPAASTIHKYHRRLRETGQFSRKRQRPSPASGEAEPDILAYAALNPHASVRGMAEARGVSKSTVWRILHGNKFHPFHVGLHQDLLPGDCEKRLEFSNWFLNMVDEDENVAMKIMFTDEANFSRDAQVNLHNAHYWAVENPRWMRKCRFQKKWSFNVWAGICNGSVVGPYFFDGALTGHRYRAEILEGVVDSFIGDISLSQYREIFFQHDGAPPHAAATATRWLGLYFPDRWIGRGSDINWPARSPDLNPMDFFFWGHLKELVYVEDPTSPAILQGKIRAACESITCRQAENAARSLVTRCQMCIAADGGHIEHLL